MEKPEEKKNKPKFSLLIHNISKKKNIGTLLRSGSAFNISKVFLISKDKEKKKDKTPKKFLPSLRFPRHNKKAFLRNFFLNKRRKRLLNKK